MSMALTINPAVSGSRRVWFSEVVLFFAGTVLGAAASLALVAFIFAIAVVGLGDSFLPILALALLGLMLLHQLGLPVPVPYRKEQVPERWRNVLPRRLVALSYGSVLGFGFLTPFTSSAHLAFLLILLFAASVPAIVGGLTLFALGKVAVLALSRGVITLDDVRNRLSSLDLSHPWRRFARIAASVAVTVFAMGSLVSFL
jgi:hypothetical protein